MEYDPSGNSKLSFHVGVDIINLFIYMTFYIFSCIADAKI